RFIIYLHSLLLLLRVRGFNLHLREHLRLLLAVAAEYIAAKTDSEQSCILIAKSVVRDPDYFLRLFDELGAAGWSLAEVDQPILSEIAARFYKICRDCGFTFVHEADRLAGAEVEKNPPRFSNPLVTGFAAAHWPLWP